MTAVPSAGTRRMALRWPSLPWKLVRIFVFYLSLLAVWQLVYKLEVWPHYVFPGPKDVWNSLQLYWDNGKLQTGIETTMKRMAHRVHTFDRGRIHRRDRDGQHEMGG